MGIVCSALLLDKEGWPFQMLRKNAHVHIIFARSYSRTSVFINTKLLQFLLLQFLLLQSKEFFVVRLI